MTRRKRQTGKMQRPALPAASNNPVVVEAPARPAGETFASAGSNAAWRVASAVVQGISHARQGLPCQDAAGYRLLENGLLVIALADGAGSASCAEQGARLAVDESLRALGDSLDDGIPEDATGWRNLVIDAFAFARQAIYTMVEEAGEMAHDYAARDYASTLTLVILTPDRMIAGQVGDGAVVAEAGPQKAQEEGNVVPEAPLSEDEPEAGAAEVVGTEPVELEMAELFAVTQLQRGEYANETRFLVEEDALEQAVIEIVNRPVQALAVMSDGLIRLALKMPSQEPHAPFFQPLFRFIKSMAGGPEAVQQAGEQLAVFLSSERVNARTDDDKSLVLAARVQDET